MFIPGGSDSSWSSGRDGEGELEGDAVTPAKYLEYGADDSDSSPPAPSHPPARRLSKDDSLSSSNSDWQPSGDEYNVYYYDPKALNNGVENALADGQSSSVDKQPEPEASTSKVITAII